MEWTNAVRFYPWIGSHYENQERPFPKLLVLGNSHYFNQEEKLTDDQKQMTTKRVVCDAISHKYNDQSYMLFFDRLHDLLEKVFSSFQEINSSNRDLHPFQKIAFYNYLQKNYDKARGNRPKSHYEESAAGFSEVVNKLSPERILVLGKVTWNKMSARVPEMHEVNDESWKQTGLELWKIPGSNPSYLTNVFHPSSSQWSWSEKLSADTLYRLMKY